MEDNNPEKEFDDMQPSYTLTASYNDNRFFLVQDENDNSSAQNIRNLVSAMMDRALRDLSNAAIEPNIKRDAWRWFESDSQEPYSFIWCCELLEISPTVVGEYAASIKTQTLKVVVRPKEGLKIWDDPSSSRHVVLDPVSLLEIV